MKILVIEDDLAVAEALKITLSNYAVEIAVDGEAGLSAIEAFNYDLILLDVILPKLDGISVCRQVRSTGYMMPILLLTSLDNNHDRAVGLDAGADDYVVKPFDSEELSARVRALLRRGNDNVQPTLTWENLSLDPCTCEVTYAEHLLSLTPKEYALLELFLRHSRRVFSCGLILEHLWTYDDTPSEEAVRTHIKGLRNKLKAVGAPGDIIETVYGLGYRLKSLTGKNSPPTTDVKSQIDRRLIDIWYRYRPQTLDRVNSIDLVIARLHDRSLTSEIQLQGCHSAHTLAGTLGTFGLPIGSQVAKQIELKLDRHIRLTPTDIPQLEGLLAQLRGEIDSQIEETISTEPPIVVGSHPPKLLAIVRDPDLAAGLKFNASKKFEMEIVTELGSRQLDILPQAIVLDLECFPQLSDGLATLTQFDRDYPTIPVLVLGKSIPSLDLRIEVAQRGGKMFLAKPATPSEILLAVDRVLTKIGITQPKVLIVDDDRSLLDGLVAILSPHGMIVSTLSEPSQFWSVLEGCTPDLLILDLDMPQHDGIELCQAVRTDPRWATLPIMFLTGHTAPLAIDRVFAAGADDFATKPIDGDALVTRIKNRLERIR